MYAAHFAGSSERRTVSGCHWPRPDAVGTWRAFNDRAIAVGPYPSPFSRAISARASTPVILAPRNYRTHAIAFMCSTRSVTRMSAIVRALRTAKAWSSTWAWHGAHRVRSGSGGALPHLMHAGGGSSSVTHYRAVPRSHIPRGSRRRSRRRSTTPSSNTDIRGRRRARPRWRRRHVRAVRDTAGPVARSCRVR